MKQNILSSIGLISVITVFVLSNILVMGLMMEYFSELSDGVIAFWCYLSAAVSTFVYTMLIKRPCGIQVPSLRPEIGKLNPRLIVLGFVFIIAVNIVIGPLIEIIPKVGMDTLDRYMNNGLWAMVTAIIVAPIFEEFLFRGVVQSNFIKHFGSLWGIVCGAIVFGVMHVVPQQAVGAMAVGLILGSIYYITGSLNTVIAIHFINNGFTYLLFMLFQDTNFIENVVLEGTTTYIITYSVCSIILILGVGYVIKHSHQIHK